MPPKKRKAEPNDEGGKDDGASRSAGPKVPWADSEKLEIMRYLLSKSPPSLSKEDLEALVRILPGRTESGISTVWQRAIRPEIIRTGNTAKLSKT